jgi:hypothetical protein
MKLWPAYLGIALCIATFVLAAVTVLGRAVDTEAQQRVVFTRNGVTLDCERIVTGIRVSYDGCITVP